MEETRFYDFVKSVKLHANQMTKYHVFHIIAQSQVQRMDISVSKIFFSARRVYSIWINERFHIEAKRIGKRFAILKLDVFVAHRRLQSLATNRHSFCEG